MRNDTKACGYCLEPVRVDTAELCDGCWELSTRIRHAKAGLLANILESERPEVVQMLRDGGPAPEVEVCHV